MEELDFSKNIDFEMLGNIERTVKEIVGEYKTYTSSDCDISIVGTNVSLPGYGKYLTYWGFYWQGSGKTLEVAKKGLELIQALLEKGLIKFHNYS